MPNINSSLNIGKKDSFQEIIKSIESRKIQHLLKRGFDIFFSLLGLLLLSPVFLLISFSLKLDSKGPVFFKQVRVGKHGKEFKIFKFRTMVEDAEKKGMQITVGKDSRITRVGKFLRNNKLDELPQLINVLLGSMSFVGPRPEVPKYVNMYTNEQKIILLVRPGITDIASIEFIDENSILENRNNPEQAYINEIMPLKIELNMKYLRDISLWHDIKLIILTLIKIIKS